MMFLALVMVAAGQRWLCASGLRVHDAVRCSWRTYKGSFSAVWAMLPLQARQREVFRVLRVLRALAGNRPADHAEVSARSLRVPCRARPFRPGALLRR